jgi:hypothetical protein
VSWTAKAAALSLSRRRAVSEDAKAGIAGRFGWD